MSTRRGTSFLANISANLVVGASALGYAVIVPAVVVRRFGSEVYGNWYLAFQIAAYIVLLDLGSQYLVTSEAALSTEDSRSARLATAAMLLQFLLALGVLCAAGIWATATNQTRLAQLIVVLGIAAIGSLLASTVRAWFGGLAQAHIPAAWLVAARVASVTGLVVAVAAGADVLQVTLAVAGPQLLIHIGLLGWSHRLASPWARPDRSTVARLVRGSLPLAVWTICGIAISGIDIFIVRAVDPSEVGRFAVALPLLSIPTGIVTAAMTAWMPRLTHAQAAAGEGGRAGTLTATTLMVAALSVGALAFVGYADLLVKLLAGPGSWDRAAVYLQLLYLASCLRFVFLPWAVLIVIRGEQGAIMSAPVIEAATNLVASVLLGAWLGAIGVAIGTLIGATVAAGAYFSRGIRLTQDSGVTAKNLAGAIGRARTPVAVAGAFGALALLHAPGLLRAGAAVVAIAIDARWIVSRMRTPVSGARLNALPEG